MCLLLLLNRMPINLKYDTEFVWPLANGKMEYNVMKMYEGLELCGRAFLRIMQ